MLDSVMQDLRYAVRALAKSPGFALTSLATLALGIGASTAIFSIVNAILITPLPFPHADRIVVGREVPNDGGYMSVSWPNYVDWRTRLQSVDDLACYRQVTLTLTGVDRPERLDGRQVTWNFFRVLGVRPTIGRTFTEAEDRPGVEHVVIVSDSFWKQRLGGDPQAIGRRLVLDDAPHTIVGVLPPGFRFIRDDAVYEPVGVLREPNSALLDRGNHMGLQAIGRLKPGRDLRAAAAELDTLSAALAKEYPNTNSGNGAHLEALSRRIVGDVRPALLVLFGAVGFLLLLSCVNVANLLVARGASRSHELSIRSALGGGRLRLMRQLLIESGVLSLAGGGLGLLVAAWLVKVFVGLAPEGIPRIDEVRLDRAVLLFAFAASALCGIVFGLFPAFQASSVDGQHLLVRSSRAGSTASTQTLRRALMVAEVALALVLLTGAGLMMRTMNQLATVDPGFSSDNLLTLRFALVTKSWKDEGRRQAFYENLLNDVRRQPGVVNAALTMSLPIAGADWSSVFIVGDQPAPPRAELPSAEFLPVSGDYFKTLGMRLVAGRLFNRSDSGTTMDVAVVNESFARRFWPGESAIGKRLKQGWPEWQTPWREVIGVVNDVKFEGVANDTPLQAYLPLTQESTGSLALVARTTGDAERFIRPLEQVIQSFDRDVPVYGVRTMRQWLDNAVARERISMVILAVFAVVALVLAGVGLYGVVSHGVTERTHEIGVRLALGADPSDVIRMFVGQGLMVAGCGVAIGLVGALGLSRFIQTLLFQVTATDPLTLGVVVSTLLAVTFGACYIPARRATRVDPTVVLRN